MVPKIRMISRRSSGVKSQELSVRVCRRKGRRPQTANTKVRPSCRRIKWPHILKTTRIGTQRLLSLKNIRRLTGLCLSLPTTLITIIASRLWKVGLLVTVGFHHRFLVRMPDRRMSTRGRTADHFQQILTIPSRFRANRRRSTDYWCNSLTLIRWNVPKKPSNSTPAKTWYPTWAAWFPLRKSWILKKRSEGGKIILLSRPLKTIISMSRWGHEAQTWMTCTFRMMRRFRRGCRVQRHLTRNSKGPWKATGKIQTQAPWASTAATPRISERRRWKILRISNLRALIWHMEEEKPMFPWVPGTVSPFGRILRPITTIRGTRSTDPALIPRSAQPHTYHASTFPIWQTTLTASRTSNSQTETINSIWWPSARSWPMKKGFRRSRLKKYKSVGAIVGLKRILNRSIPSTFTTDRVVWSSMRAW